MEPERKQILKELAGRFINKYYPEYSDNVDMIWNSIIGDMAKVKTESVSDLSLFPGSGLAFAGKSSASPNLRPAMFGVALFALAGQDNRARMKSLEVPPALKKKLYGVISEYFGSDEIDCPNPVDTTELCKIIDERISEKITSSVKREVTCLGGKMERIESGIRETRNALLTSEKEIRKVIQGPETTYRFHKPFNVTIKVYANEIEFRQGIRRDVCPLTKQQTEILMAIAASHIESNGESVSYDEIKNRIVKWDDFPLDTVKSRLYRIMTNLNKVLGTHSDFIDTVPGTGYRLTVNPSGIRILEDSNTY